MLSMLGGAVLLARVPAHGLEGAQAGVHGSAPISRFAQSGRRHQRLKARAGAIINQGPVPRVLWVVWVLGLASAAPA